MNEEFILQSIVIAIWMICIITAMIFELFRRRKEIDDITKIKLKRITLFAFKHFIQKETKENAKKKAISFAKEVLKNNELNQKYDLIKGA